MTTKERYTQVLARFQSEMPTPETELRFANPFQLLVAVILSAQCTDKRVNTVTPELFKAFPTPQLLAEATPDEVYEYIKSVSYPNNKTRSLIGMAQRLVAEYNGIVPSDMDSLLSLPGVGRKTANVVLAVVFGRAAMPVDTHVFRVSHRIGLVSDAARTPLETEKKLSQHIPAELLSTAHHWLILHGRYVCRARSPQCKTCYLADLCKYGNKTLNNQSKTENDKPDKSA